MIRFKGEFTSLRQGGGWLCANLCSPLTQFTIIVTVTLDSRTSAHTNEQTENDNARCVRYALQSNTLGELFTQSRLRQDITRHFMAAKESDDALHLERLMRVSAQWRLHLVYD